MEIEIGGNRAYMIQKDEKVSILMNKDNKQFFLSGTISEEEAIKIMESIKQFFFFDIIRD